MCIIAYKPKGITIKKDVYAEMYRSNKDGAGFIVREKTGELKMEKGFFSFESFWENFQPHQSKQAIVHFRITTHGKTDEENCHPFWVKDQSLAFAHNGVITNVTTTDDWSKSDTWHFNKKILQPLLNNYGEKFIEDPVMQELISEYIGYSKLAFLHESGHALIFNKSAGVMDNGVWYSNHSYKKYEWVGQQNNNRGKNGRFQTGTTTPYVPPTGGPTPNAANSPITDAEALEELDRQAIATACRIGGIEDREDDDDFYAGTVRRLMPPVSVPANPVLLAPIPPYSRDSRFVMEGDYIEMVQAFGGLRGTEIGKVLNVRQNRHVEAAMHLPGTMAQRTIILPYHVFQKYITSGEQP